MNTGISRKIIMILIGCCVMIMLLKDSWSEIPTFNFRVVTVSKQRTIYEVNFSLLDQPTEPGTQAR